MPDAELLRRFLGVFVEVSGKYLPFFANRFLGNLPFQLSSSKDGTSL
jgi:hypothetical protein